MFSKGRSFQYTGFKCALLLVDYDTASVNTHASACDVDEKCDRHHLSSNHLDIEAIINKGFDIFYAMSRNLLEESRLKQGRFCDSSKGHWEEGDFQHFPQ